MVSVNSHLRWFFALFLFVSINEQVLGALEFHEIRWGFDNRLIVSHINPVTVLVENPDSEPFEGDLFLSQESLRGQQIDIALEATTYIAPFERKWIQYYPYITDNNSNWRITWNQKDIKHSKTFLAPRPVQEKSIIQLVTPDNLPTGIPGLKQFPEDLFPPVTGATDSLQVILLDHLPRWEKSRREAFKEWIYSGGVLHLYKNSNGDPLSLPLDYLPLNRQTSPAYYGNGIIYFHEQKLIVLSPTELSRDINSNKLHSAATSNKAEIKNNVLPTATTYSSSDYANNYYQNVDEELLATLTEISKPKQIWYLIFLLSFIYLIIVGPVYYLISKNSKYTSRFYIIYGLSTLFFCFIFLLAGRYSTNRTSQIHSLIIAECMPENKSILTEWSSLGIVSGGNFKIAHAGDSHIYSTCQAYLKVNGISSSGKNGNIQVDIPPNSFRTFFHRSRISKSFLDIKLNSFLSNESGLEVLSLEMGKEFPDKIEQVHFVFGSKIYELEVEQKQLLYRGKSRRLYPLLKENPLLDTSYLSSNRFFPVGKTTNKKKPEFVLKPFFPVLVQKSLNVTPDRINQHFSWPENNGKLLVFAKIPDPLFPESPSIYKKEGLILYSLDVSLADQKN